ncbi:hypothetical protein VTP01DRAFT_7248 [Rhizomucor pusillus]|uniref:uncharacterized protein n=1 Tax=Rhizomucor pusillus TaxID=4840 RepID=UPI0037433C74
MFPPEIIAEFQLLMQLQWQFLGYSWPTVTKTRYHRSEIKEVNDISFIKSYVLDRLGYIPVFFFLVVFFGSQEYPGPYRIVEKGLLILYHLLSRCSVADMGRFVPRSSFTHCVVRFYIKNGAMLSEVVTNCLVEMFSNVKIKVLCATHINPSEFKHLTLLLDGHDTRASYLRSGDDHGSFYSYKLKKGGLRSQFCIDVNGKVIFVSDASPCAANNDGSMLASIELKDLVTKWDSIGLDGGYTLYVPGIIARNSYLTSKNFVCPIRKSRASTLSQDEDRYNKSFGSFRSKIEALFGELGHVFNRLNGKSVIRVSDIDTFTIQLKLAYLLLNIKRFVSLGGVTSTAIHTFWLQDGFDYGNDGLSTANDVLDCTISDKVQDAESMRALQEQFLSEEIPTDHYEGRHIASHRGARHTRQYRVRWTGYTATDDNWVSAEDFADSSLVDEYEARMETRTRQTRPVSKVCPRQSHPWYTSSKVEHLSDTHGVNFVQHATGAFEGWSDSTDIFVDNVVFWCTTMYYLARNRNEIGSYVQKIRAAFSRYLDPAMFVVMYVCSGCCPDDSVIPADFHRIKADQLNFEPGWDYFKGFIEIKVSFDEIALELVLRVLRNVQLELHDNLIVMHDLDISVDCGLVSTRDLIESYITQVLEVDPSDIVSDRHRVKIYDTFVQMIESTDARSCIGSQLSNFVANKSEKFTGKLLRYKDTGMTVLMNDLVHKTSRCSTYQISFENHWKSVGQRIRSTVAFYDCENKTFAYCHWWNSLAKRMQGLVKGNISEQHVQSILANFTFNHRPMHYFFVRLVGKECEIVRRSRYIRAEGCTSMTFVSGPGNSLVLSKYFINDRPVLSFGFVGFTTHENITLGWSTGHMKYGQTVDGVQLLEHPDHAETVNNARDVGDDALRLSESVNMSIFQADYNRGKEYLCVSTSCEIHARGRRTLDNLVRSRISQGRHVLVRVIKQQKTKGTRDMICEFDE